MRKIVIAKAYSHLRSYIENIHTCFEQDGELIWDERNKIKRIKIQDTDLCVKAYGKPTLFNRVMYSYIRKSKAQRSYNYARRMAVLGIDTPEPIAYVEVYNACHYLTHSYFICRFEEVEFSFAEVLDSNSPDKHPIVSGFVNYMINGLHAAGVFHKDFNGTNVLVKNMGHNRYQYLLIDLNRVRFKRRINYHEGLRNLQQISSNPEYLTVLAKYYAHIKKIDEDDTIYEVMFLKSYLRLKRRYTKRFLHALKSVVQLAH
ncbi:MULTISPECIES: lipopolysaccharide kinase InaA family protein [unclassified Carboxylicivirga]|uniref:lipopolysaccharide kinase InaA family protein n=1 Tax=Carboxylicivirga TaxID=1628153 RepID=UPI003D350B1F